MPVQHIVAVAIILLTAACAPTQTALDPHPEPNAHLPDNGPPVTDGPYYNWGSCPGEGCGLGDLFATTGVDLLSAPNPHARVVARVRAHEWVRSTNSVSIVRPLRGVVVGQAEGLYGQGPPLAVGDVVYYLDYVGEGAVLLWLNGVQFDWMDEGLNADGVSGGIRWERVPNNQHEADAAAGAGWWVEVERTNGERGWLRSLDGIDCIGVLDPSERCTAGPPTR